MYPIFRHLKIRKYYVSLFCLFLDRIRKLQLSLPVKIPEASFSVKMRLLEPFVDTLT